MTSRLPFPARAFAVAVLLGFSLAAPGLAAAPGPVVPDTLAQRLEACVVCHGKEGRATAAGYLPRIAGKPAGYLFNQLLNFRDGRRSNATMSYLVQNMSDAYLREIADHFAALDLPYPPPPASAPAAALARGEAVVRRGDAALGVPACTRCHGAAMTGSAPAMPGLLGLPRDYLLGQFGAWKTGQRKALAPDCMAQIVQRLPMADVVALADWLASQPVPAATAAAHRVDLPLPLECGSVRP